MIEFHKQTDFQLEDQERIANWLSNLIQTEGKDLGDLAYIFCTDDYLHDLNVRFLDHDTLTDVIGFDNSLGDLVEGEIYISVERVADNAKDFGQVFEDELYRVMAHGLLHFCGYADKTEAEAALMREKENIYLKVLKNR